MEVTFKLNVDDSEEMLQKGKAAIDSFFNSLLGTELKVEVPATVEETEEKPKRKRRTKAEIAADKAAKEAEETKQQEDEGEDLEELSFEELSTAVASKIKKLKDAGKPTAPIVKKLKSFGASKLDELEEKYYGKFMNYIEKL